MQQTTLLRLKEGELFFRQWLRSPKSMGSVIPSSRALARAIASHVSWRPGQYVVELGGGRRRPDDAVDHAVGLTRLVPVGARIFTGELLALVHARSQAQAESAAASVLSAYRIGETKPSPQRAVIRRIGPR